jgi:hypothetical protein
MTRKRSVAGVDTPCETIGPPGLHRGVGLPATLT